MMLISLLRDGTYDDIPPADRQRADPCSVKTVWIPVFLIGILLVGACERAASRKPGESFKERERRVHEELVAFGREFDASTAWLSVLTRDEIEPFELYKVLWWDRAVYTADLQGAFTETPRVAFRANMIDVIRLEQGYEITLAFPEDPPMIVFILVASEEQAELLLQDRPQLWESVSVAATVNRVSRPIFKASATAYTDYAELEFDVMPPFVAHGSLLALKSRASK